MQSQEDQSDGYLGSSYRMDIAQPAFASLFHLWMDHSLSLNMKLRLYKLCICSTLTHSCEGRNLTKAVSRNLKGFTSRCLHVITEKEYHDTALSPAYNLLFAVRQRSLRYLGHLLCLPRDSMVRRSLMAMAGGGNRYPEGILFMDNQGSELKYLDTLAYGQVSWLRFWVVLTLNITITQTLFTTLTQTLILTLTLKLP